MNGVLGFEPALNQTTGQKAACQAQFAAGPVMVAYLPIGRAEQGDG
jgi:hypothetical protein